MLLLGGIMLLKHDGEELSLLIRFMNLVSALVLHRKDGATLSRLDPHSENCAQEVHVGCGVLEHFFISKCLS